MAVVVGNSPLKDLSGSIDELVFKKYKDKTVVTRKPTRKRKKNSPLQQLRCDRFKDASRHARTILRDPAKREHYRKLAIKLKKHCAYNVIISEYMLSVDMETKTVKSSGKGKTRIVLSATKKAFKVKQVEMKITSPAGKPLATGLARQINSTDWVYTPDIPLPQTGTLVVTATDALDQITLKIFRFDGSTWREL
ncbi:hypothetical protein [Dawidia soli]|uniref:Uncharacterized protein n=1 Tax=Dawidia soli TaxID=2782352 RepID=A0AAP2DAV2_9BACT|nr:hypothetical protein [Dawidia soli]MBT1688142.1 hypothetical protein [Dawidia soli]